METIIERNDMISRNIFGKFSLYVGDLDPSVEDGDLYKKFSEIGEVSSVKICRDCINGSSLGYAYVNFNHGSDADKAMKELNFKEVKGKQMRIMFSKRDPSIRNSGKGNMFVKNLDKSFDNKQLHHLFSSFGLILSCKVACDASGVSMGYGFVQYYSETSVLAAKIALDGAFVRNQYLKVCPFVSRRQWDESPVFTNVYVKNLVETTTDDDLKRIFKVFGEITSAVVMKDGKGKSRKFGFVNFEKAEAAAIAVEKMNGMVVEEKELYVGRAQKKKNRIEELRNQIKQEKTKEDVKNLNLYVKNLDNSVNEEKLREVFSEFGTITSCKVMVHSNGLSKGVGFVAFSTSEEASKAMIEMNGKTVGKKPIYVSLAQRKEEREVVSSVRKPSLHHGLQPIFGQGNGPTMMLPPHPPFRGYNIEPPQPQFIFGARSPNGCSPMLVPNFMMPFPFQRPALYPPSPISLHHGLQHMTSMPLPQPQPWNPIP